MSQKYAAWAHYAVPAAGFGSHAWLLRNPATVRLTQAELEAHPQRKGFGNQAAYHPPMRGWQAAPILGSDGTVWGLIQLSDRYSGEFTAGRRGRPHRPGPAGLGRAAGAAGRPQPRRDGRRGPRPARRSAGRRVTAGGAGR